MIRQRGRTTTITLVRHGTVIRLTTNLGRTMAIRVATTLRPNDVRY